MKLFTLLFILLSQYSNAFVGLEFKAGSFYDTNVYYSEQNEKTDFILFLNPNYERDFQLSGGYKITPDLGLTYNKYLSESLLDYFEYDLAFKNEIRVSRKFIFEFNPNTEMTSEPAYTSTADTIQRDERLQKNKYGLDVGFQYFKTDRKSWIFDLSYEQESFDQDRYKKFDNTHYNGTLYYKKYFLPETFIFGGYRGGFKSYPEGRDTVVGLEKFNHTRYEPGVGVEGRLTKYFKLRGYLGYAVLSYNGGKGYRDPVFLVEVEEELSPKDLLVMGYGTSAEDSFYANYKLEQKLFLGYGRLFGDQLFLTSRIEYIYSSFIGTAFRDDQHIAFSTRAEYSLSQRTKYEFFFNFNQIESNALNLTRADLLDPVDPPVSFKSIQLGFLIKYLY